jgi:hypothetical protein
MEHGDIDDSAFADLLASMDIEDDVKYPDRILERLLSTLVTKESKYSTRYEPFINDDRPGLTEWLTRCLSPRVYQLFSDSTGVIPRERYVYRDYDR